MNFPFVLISTSKRLASSRIKLIRRDDNSLFLTLSTAPGLLKKKKKKKILHLYKLIKHTHVTVGDPKRVSTKPIPSHQ